MATRSPESMSLLTVVSSACKTSQTSGTVSRRAIIVGRSWLTPRPLRGYDDQGHGEGGEQVGHQRLQRGAARARPVNLWMGLPATRGPAKKLSSPDRGSTPATS